ncbi:MAG: EAL domain-containing protein (putative c-di-GMP-specific phosphodiesterase class I) [Oceanicoccus sp.]|jgi:EAL domain-containing protein (putative c-di-GMP-specific phosphodiesterase class I)
MSSVISLCIAFMLLSRCAFGMEIVLDDSERIELREPIPSLINADNRQHPPEYWLKQDFSVDAFVPSTQPSPLSSWHKIRLKGQFDGPYSQERIISIESHILRHLNVYLFDGDKRILQAELGLLKSTRDADKPFTGTNFHFYIQHNQRLTLLIEKQNDGPAILPMSIYSEDGFHDLVRFQDFFWASIISVLIAMAIYNVLVYAMHPSSAYIWYLCFHSIAFFYFCALNGFGYLFIPQSIQMWLAQNIMFLNYVLIFLVVNFSNAFLESSKNAPWHHKYIHHFRAITALGAISSLFIAEYNMIPFFVVFQICASTYGISMGVVALKNGFTPAKYFLISWIFTLTGGAVGMATVVNILPINFFTLHGFLFGTLMELFLLSVALASRMKHMEDSLLNQLYYYPDTHVANLNYLKYKLPDHIDDIKSNYENPVFIIADIQGLREVVSLYGPNQLTNLYQKHTDTLTTYLSSKEWAIPLPMPFNRSVYLMALPAEQILILVDLPIVKSDDALTDIIDDIVKQAEESFNINSQGGRLQFTAGCAIMGNNDTQETFRQAQVALLSCLKFKKKWLLYDPNQDNAISMHVTMISDLQTAIHQDDLDIYIQPQINLTTDKICGGEILLRWNHAEKGPIPPIRFIPLAEQSGLVYQITQCVFIKSCQWLAHLNDNKLLHNDFTLSINLSALDMAEPKLITFIKECLERFQLEARFFILEVTESAVMDNPELFIATINEMKSIGFKISIDDFGTGYSSMLYLQNIDPDEIKIDMAFVRDIHLNPRKQHIVRAIIQLAHSNNATIVAEGIENEHELNFIIDLHCDYAQGYHWCPAIPLADFEQQYLSPLRLK